MFKTIRKLVSFLDVFFNDTAAGEAMKDTALLLAGVAFFILTIYFLGQISPFLAFFSMFSAVGAFLGFSVFRDDIEYAWRVATRRNDERP